MFTGIVQGVATISDVTDHNGIRRFAIQFPQGFCDELEIGASVSIDGVCLTATQVSDPDRVLFDVMLQSMNVTTLGNYRIGATVNAERAAREGAEIGGHPLSGHIDFKAEVIELARMDDNFRMRIGVAPQWLRYIFPKGYIAVNGASLTIAEVDKQAGWFEIWLIPETLRMTTIGEKPVGEQLNIEIERETRVMVDTIRETLEENLGELMPALEELLAVHGIDISALVQKKPRGA